MILTLGVWISGVTIGDSADELIDWFNHYDTRTKTEKTVDGTIDPYGTAITYDLTYHAITTVYSFMVLTGIMIGGYVFTFNFASFGGPVQACDIEGIDETKYDYISTGVKGLKDGTY